MTVPRLASVPVVVIAVAGGVWIAGGLVTDDFRLAMALTAAWIGATGVVCLAVALRHRTLRVPVAAAWVLTTAVIGTYLGLTTLVDRTVHEQVVVAGPMAPAAPRANVGLASGRLRSGEHATSGRVAVVRVADGRRFLTLTRFRTSPGPDLRVRLVPGASRDGGADDAVDLGALKGNRGDQQYRLPSRVAVDDATVVIWCRAFSVDFGSARLIAGA